MSLKYDNFIFDFYGTLVDIKTDEASGDLWKVMSGMYSCYGADYTPDQMQQSYFDIVREEEQELAFQMAISFPEIQIQKVFARLLLEAPVHHKSESPVAAMNQAELENSDWVRDICNMFRTLSRIRLQLYPHTMDTLSKLKKQGAGIYLLSNAQSLFTRAEIEESGIVDLFDAIYISSDAHMKKPQPQFMQKLLAEQGLAADRCVMIGNEFQSDVAVAASCGVDSIFLNTDGLSGVEMNARLSRVVDGHFRNYKPYMIESGDISEVLKIC